MPVDPKEIVSVKIFPPIGIARVGDSGFDLETGKPELDSLEYFLPAEIPGRDDDVFRDGFKFREDSSKREERLKRKVKEKLSRIQNGHEDDLDKFERIHREKLLGQVETVETLEEHFTEKYDSPHDRIKRQAVRFRVYAYGKDGANLGEITAKDGYKLTWTVHVANHKAAAELFRGIDEEPIKSSKNPEKLALRNPDVQGNRKPENRDRLIIDPGEKSMSSPDINSVVNLFGKFHGSNAEGVTVHLGQLRTNEEGHLIFIGGAGYAGCVTNPHVRQPDIVSEFDSADWFDDICDGWTEVFVDHNDLKTAIRSSSKATILSAPPKFPWGVRSPTTWYDIIADIYAKKSENKWQDDRGNGVEFYRDIWPILQGVYALSWTNKEAFEGHGVSGKGNYLDLEDTLKSNKPENKVFRQAIFNRIRAPDYTVLSHASTRYMPRLSGNDGDAVEPGMNLPPGTTEPPIKNYAALTALQYERFTLWKDGKFESKGFPWEGKSNFEDVRIEDQPACLTLAALDHTIGDPLFPGIEVYWIARKLKIYVLDADTDKYRCDPPFRIDHSEVPPGHITRGLSLPWQSDFNQCHTHWWPSSRPDDVIRDTDFPGTVIPEAEFINQVLPQRKKWTRGIRVSPDDNPDYYPGSTDMVKYWSRLGFVVKHNKKKIMRADGKDDPVWLEVEREKVVRKDWDKKTHLPVSVGY